MPKRERPMTETRTPAELADALDARASLYESSSAGMGLALVNLPQALREAAAALRQAEPPPSVLDGIKAHWFTQGGESQFGSLDEATNADELVSTILRLVRKETDELESHLE